MLRLPSLEEENFPKHLRKDAQALRNEIITRLIQEEQSYFGLIWKPFYVTKKSDKIKKSIDSQYGDNLVYFFAIDGCDFRSLGHKPPRKGEVVDSHSPMEISALWDWFCPREQNKGMTYCKMFSWMALGLSKTIPTVVFRPSQIRRIPDILAEISTGTQRKVMNDGCARISRHVALAVAERFSPDYYIPTPSAFQGRTGGAKGMWMVDIEDENTTLSSERDFWIEISDSQQKFESHPIDLTDPDPDRVTFEVHDRSKPLRSAVLKLPAITYPDRPRCSKNYSSKTPT